MLVGALQELAKHQTLDFPQGIYGVSIGALLGTALAYNIPPLQIQKLFQSVSLGEVAPSLRLAQLLEAPKTKGLYSMDEFEEVVLKTFRSNGIDLSTAKISEAPQPLHIVASNLSRCTPTVFTGEVRIMDALKASCALPLYFQPQTIYDSVYVDGGMYVPSIGEILPDTIRDSALILNLSRPRRGIRPEELAEVTPWNYLERLYQTSVEYRLRTTIGPNSVWLRNEEVGTMDTLNETSQNALVQSGASQFAAFWAKLLDQP